MSRTGDRREILRGPLYYGIVFVVLTLLYWVNSPIGMVALMLMCGGDGLADIYRPALREIQAALEPPKILGRFGCQCSWAVYFCGNRSHPTFFSRLFPDHLSTFLPRVTLIALAATLVETLPIKDLDNLTITLLRCLIWGKCFSSRL